jgi:hypothetical protein
LATYQVSPRLQPEPPELNACDSRQAWVDVGESAL